MSATSEPAATAAWARKEVRQAVWALLMGSFAAVLASTIVTNALPAMVADLGASQSAYTWVVTVELLALTASVPVWGKLADLYDQKRLLQLSMLIFIVGSIAAGAAANLELLLAGRVLQGIGAGGLTALVQIVIAAMIPPRELGRLGGMFSVAFAVATVAGPLIGGFLVDIPLLGWRWCFYIGVPVCLIAMVQAHRNLKLATVPRGGKVDYPGAVLVVAAVCTLLLWISLGGKQFDWVSGTSLLLLLASVALFALFAFVESRATEPIVPLRIFRNRTVTLSLVGVFFVGVGMFGSTVFLTQYFQLALGHQPSVAGLMSLPMILAIMLVSPVSGSWITRTGHWRGFLIAGGFLLVAGLGLLGTIDAHTPWWLTVGYTVVLGVGIGLLVQNMILVVQNDVAAIDLGVATAAVTFFRQIGGTIGVAALGAVLAAQVAAAGYGAVPKIHDLDPAAATVVRDAYGTATGEVFLLATPLAALALIAILFLRQIPLKTQSGAERLAAETAAAEAEAAKA
ncbi:EmrB/QacA subfamily drug resistance transporter [Crossiella equi]|uniref:EmrB/QacA subfamily drug resistance transporter n=1 Tax=Crossiella equi TaxID=130796 RepID=A0ABS5A9X8_9PSEU|nr:MFS transporter [Crossiella equi]MBP2473386.1 EmrB/QacA subfamily drug resistance transporter [Crossiella equi]